MREKSITNQDKVHLLIIENNCSIPNQFNNHFYKGPNQKRLRLKMSPRMRQKVSCC